jgi:hypothetical protein
MYHSSIIARWRHSAWRKELLETFPWSFYPVCKNTESKTQKKERPKHKCNYESWEETVTVSLKQFNSGMKNKFNI